MRVYIILLLTFSIMSCSSASLNGQQHYTNKGNYISGGFSTTTNNLGKKDKYLMRAWVVNHKLIFDGVQIFMDIDDANIDSPTRIHTDDWVTTKVIRLKQPNNYKHYLVGAHLGMDYLMSHSKGFKLTLSSVHHTHVVSFSRGYVESFIEKLKKFKDGSHRP